MDNFYTHCLLYILYNINLFSFQRQFFFETDYKLWNDVVPDFVYDEKAKFFDLVVPTVDSTCYSYLMEMMVRDRKSVYLTGVTGTGKSVLATTLVDSLQTSKEEGGAACAGLVINFSAKTSSNVIQGTIEDSLERKTRTTLGPPRGQSGMMIFVDDVNMPEVEIYGAQPPIELLRQLIDSNGFYEREEWLWRMIENTVVCVGAAPPGGGRSAVTQRFVRHFMVLCVPDPSDDGLQRIFENILTGFLTAGQFHGDILDLSSGKYSSERAAREWSTVVDIYIEPPSFKLVLLSSPRSPLSKTPKHVIF